MPDIKITVAEKIATNTTPGVVIVCGNSDYKVIFDFDEEWATETSRVARFCYYKDGLSLYKDVDFTGATVDVPILYGVDYVLVGVYAGDLRTTTPAKVLCDRSILCGDPLEVTPGQRPALEELEGQMASLEGQMTSLEGQVETLASDIDVNTALLRDGKYALDIGEVAPGTAIRVTTGQYETGKTDQGLGASEHYIPLNIGTKYQVTTTNIGFNIFFYGSDKTFIEAWVASGSTTKDAVTFTNTKYHYARVGAWCNTTMTQALFDTISFAAVSDGDSLQSLRDDLNALPDSTPSQTTAHPKPNGWIESNYPILIDTTAKTLTFGATAFIGYGGEKSNVANKSFDISTLMSGGFAYFHPSTNTITRTYAEGAVFLGSVWSPAHLHGLHVDKDRVLVDGMPVTFSGRYLRKTVNVLGDSMTEGTGLPSGTKLYHYWIKQLCGFNTVNNYGVGGSCISPKSDDVVSWDTVDSFYTRYPSMADGADAVIVFGGTNDWTYGHELGTIADTGTDTFYGAMKALCEGLRAKYPAADLFVFGSPQSDYTKRRASSLSGEWAGNNDGYNRKGLKLQDYTSAMGEVCAIYGIPFCDMSKGLWWGPSGVLGVYQGNADGSHIAGIYGIDSLHPNAEGHKKIALKMADFINSN